MLARLVATRFLEIRQALRLTPQASRSFSTSLNHVSTSPRCYEIIDFFLLLIITVCVCVTLILQITIRTFLGSFRPQIKKRLKKYYLTIHPTTSNQQLFLC
uniref:Uncharacterized protein n=1 Tax=Salix viminalis TaxID=40686 RepID=A0A6N2LF07_SALVM